MCVNVFCLYFLELLSTQDYVPGGSDDDFLFHLQEKIPQTPRPLSGRSPREALSPTGTPQQTQLLQILKLFHTCCKMITRCKVSRAEQQHHQVDTSALAPRFPRPLHLAIRYNGNPDTLSTWQSGSPSLTFFV